MQRIFVKKISGGEIKDGNIVLIKIPYKKISETKINLLKHYISDKNYNVVYVTVNKPFSELINEFKKEKIDTNKIFIIDAVTPRKLTNIERGENCVFVGSPKELTNISITTTSTVEKLNTAKILIFDSISTLLFYNSFETAKEFIRFISNKMKELKVTFAIICIKDTTDEDVISQLSTFVDDVIEIE
jgi:archaellum biogenesis ATPase FlaH